jgi:hypothetical protein
LAPAPSREEFSAKPLCPPEALARFFRLISMFQAILHRRSRFCTAFSL